MSYQKTIDLYGDDIGKVQYVDHMGSDLTIVNSARVSFGVEKEELNDRDKKLINYLVKSYICLSDCGVKENMVLYAAIVYSNLLCRLKAGSWIVISKRRRTCDITVFNISKLNTSLKALSC